MACLSFVLGSLWGLWQGEQGTCYEHCIFPGPPRSTQGGQASTEAVKLTSIILYSL